MKTDKNLEWKEEYSVGVQLIDEQHKMIFATINELVDMINTTPTKEKLAFVIGQLVAYKKFHFATEEKYFVEFHYEGTEEHIAKHKMFNDTLEKVQEECGDDMLTLAFRLVDFLEDWLIDHLMTVDQEYKVCFAEHGLK
ncbi:MAG: bacteriohemerythrin [Candidatus Moraniibacteriota bacterium]